MSALPPKADIKPHRLECLLSAMSSHSAITKNTANLQIAMPVEEPLTASIADISNPRQHSYRCCFPAGIGPAANDHVLLHPKLYMGK
jgi:hypothetical protein